MSWPQVWHIARGRCFIWNWRIVAHYRLATPKIFSAKKGGLFLDLCLLIWEGWTKENLTLSPWKYRTTLLLRTRIGAVIVSLQYYLTSSKRRKEGAKTVFASLSLHHCALIHVEVTVAMICIGELTYPVLKAVWIIKPGLTLALTRLAGKKCKKIAFGGQQLSSIIPHWIALFSSAARCIWHQWWGECAVWTINRAAFAGSSLRPSQWSRLCNNASSWYVSQDRQLAWSSSCTACI